MLYEVMRHCRNFFPKERREGTFEIKDGIFSLPFVYEGQYFLIEGSVLNDGLYQYPATDLVDEKFDGCVTALAIPKPFISLVNDIKEFCDKNPEGAYQSESFGGYSYTRATVDGKVAGWQEVFSGRLSDWRKI